MPAMNKLSAAEKEQYCQKIYGDYIVETAEFLESCDECAKVLRTYIPSGCYTNFRDMLFHFRCMVNVSEEGALLGQVASIVEHAHRAMRDAEVALCLRCATVFRMLLLRNPDLKEDIVNGIYAQIDLLQDCVLKLRLGGMMLEGMEFLRPSNEEFLNILTAYLQYAEDHVAEEFYAVIGYSQELKVKFSKHLKKAFTQEAEEDFRNFKAFSTYNDVAELVYAAVFSD